MTDVHLRVTLRTEAMQGLPLLGPVHRFGAGCLLLLGFQSPRVRLADGTLRMDSPRGIAGMPADGADSGGSSCVQGFWF